MTLCYPCTYMIRIYELGYGVDIPHPTMNVGANDNDGLYINDIRTGHCTLLVSLRSLIHILPPPYQHATAYYGFHVKWSSDNLLILFILRSVSPRYSGLRGLLSTAKTRTQHAIVMFANGTCPIHIISWSSTKTSDIRVSNTNREYVNRNGNHPSWVPGTHSISMNLSPINSSSHKVFELVIFQINILNDGILSVSEAFCVHRHGYGHPSFRWGGRYVVMDMYVKEARRWALMKSNGNKLNGSKVKNENSRRSRDKKYENDFVPLLLVDIQSKTEVVLSHVSFFNYYTFISLVLL